MNAIFKCLLPTVGVAVSVSFICLTRLAFHVGLSLVVVPPLNILLGIDQPPLLDVKSVS